MDKEIVREQFMAVVEQDKIQEWEFLHVLVAVPPTYLPVVAWQVLWL